MNVTMCAPKPKIQSSLSQDDDNNYKLLKWWPDVNDLACQSEVKS